MRKTSFVWGTVWSLGMISVVLPRQRDGRYSPNPSAGLPQFPEEPPGMPGP
jgi:hypothetical protein